MLILQINKNQLISRKNWLISRLNELQATITLQKDHNENQPELQKQNNPFRFQQSATPSFEQKIQELNRQIDDYLNQISDEPIRDRLKTTLTLTQKEDKWIKDPSQENKKQYFYYKQEQKRDLCTAIFHYLIQFDPRNPKRANRPLILSDKKIKALDLLLKIIENSENDNLHSLVAMWVQADQKKQSFFGFFYPKKDNPFKDHFLNKIAQALGKTTRGELEKLATPTHSQEYENIQRLAKAQTVKPAPN